MGDGGYHVTIMFSISWISLKEWPHSLFLSVSIYSMLENIFLQLFYFMMKILDVNLKLCGRAFGIQKF